MENQQRNRILALLFVGVFMGALDIGIVGPALPAIKSFFMVNERLVSWIFTIYILFFMIGTPLMAKLSDMYGRRMIYILDIILFAIGSVLTASSFSYELLLVGRAIQGFGAGGIFPVASAFIGDTFPPEKRGSALGIIGSVFGLSGVLGPILGGLLLNFGWQWLFIINIPLAAIIVLFSFYILPKSIRKWTPAFDWRGALVLVFLVSSFAYGINQIDTNNLVVSLESLEVWPFILISLSLLPLLYKLEEKAEDPIIQIDLLKIREVRLATGISIGSGLSQAGIVFVPSFAMTAFLLSDSIASLMVTPLVITMAISAPLIGKLLDKYGSKKIMTTGSAILLLGFFMISLFSNSFYLFILSGIVIGLGLITILGSPLRYIMLSESPPEHRASGQALININASVGQLVGGAFIGALIASKNGQVSGYSAAYIMLGVVVSIVLMLTFGLKNREQQLKAIKKNLNI
ncbi:MAG: MFS transporter [Methanobacteriaceae archaeon]|nr:MFS transporter [Methanobacteriaceae archaeon]